jgi:hypothetical protein
MKNWEFCKMFSEYQTCILEIAKQFSGEYISEMTKKEILICNIIQNVGIGKWVKVKKDNGNDQYFHLVD